MPLDLIIIVVLISVQLSLALWSAMINKVVNPPLQLVLSGAIFMMVLFYLGKYGMYIVNGIRGL